MNFDFSDDAKALREQARRFLDERATTKVARTQMAADSPYDTMLWTQVVELGWTAARVPEAMGGLGLGGDEACVLAEEIGRSLAPVPFMSTLLATEALVLVGTEEQQTRWLGGFAEGALIGCVGWGEGDAASPARAGAKVTGDRITGIKVPVPDLMAADVALVSAQGPDGVQLYVIDLSDPGVTREAADTIDLVRRHGRLTLTNAPCAPLGTPDTYHEWLDRAAILTSFEALGTASAAMAMAIGYAKERTAFGQKIGRYQGVKHKCADMYIKLELARAHALHGAWAMQDGAAELRQAAAAARVASLDALAYCAEENLQIHGGTGFTWDSDCQFYYRRNRAIVAALGSKTWWSDRLVRALERRNALAA
ncbi:acyl-CoA dehydrogenase family protein [Glacieibacterium frigidum]|uniref:Acyl-CoA dehydrogenase n=1 Tax=Glacieibacterium frigidum TaxID=2593303 RepID=A0A552UHX0_9SPHN|nr:acyl-CoA dehydrogenase family protein [Glacieibacterium frigidum]TRW17790.1 acyl-CoA dehydrogenase [Glacieibacterium frigidum]